MSRRLLASSGLLALALSWSAVASEPPTVPTPLPFDHAAHTRTLDKAGLACTDCHPVGLAPARSGDPPPPLPPPPTESCHGCHLGTLMKAPRRAPRTCETCHPVRAELRPDDHTVLWPAGHTDAALAPGNTCSDCHARRWCVDCHDDRGPLATSPHGPGFRATHGVQARVDPASCSSCHAGPSCTACHAKGDLPW
jgi:hypothetical protein